MELKLSSLILATLLLSGCGESSSDESVNSIDDEYIETLQETFETCEYNEATMRYVGLGGSEFETLAPCMETAIGGNNPCSINKEEPNEFITQEYCKNHGLSMMNTSSAYVAGASGQGVVVAVLDSRIESTHSEFINRLSSASTSFASSTSSHGTQVGGVIGANKDDDYDIDYDGMGMQGVAYNAEILSVGVSSGTFMEISNIVQGISYATANGADVVNMSFGNYDSNIADEYKEALKNGVDSDMTFVMSAGNYGIDCLTALNCHYPSAIPFLNGNSDLLNSQGGWIIVGAVDLSGEMTGISNKAGIRKSNFVVALGDGTYTTNTEGGYITNEGTSLSAPHVAGVVALMKDSFPHLSGREIANIIFETCTDLGEEGVDDVYGHGLVNVKKAFELAQTR